MCIQVSAVSAGRSCFGLVSCFASLTINQHQVPQVDDAAERLAEDEDRIGADEGVNEQAGASEKAEVPEGERHDGAFLAFGGDPLDDEAQ